MRGIASMAKAVTPALASARVVSGEVSGARNAISTEPSGSVSISSDVGAVTRATTFAPSSAESPCAMRAPASSNRASGISARSPAPLSTTTSCPFPVSRLITSGTSATRRSPPRDSFGTAILIPALPAWKAGESNSRAKAQRRDSPNLPHRERAGACRTDLCWLGLGADRTPAYNRPTLSKRFWQRFRVTKAVQERERVVVRFAGDSGDGMQLVGSRFTDATAMIGNDLATLPDFPAEIRAPAGTLHGVSAFQIHFASRDILTPGDHPNVLVAMNPAALKTNLGALEKGGTIIVNDDAFTDNNLRKAGYDADPLDDGTLESYQ